MLGGIANQVGKGNNIMKKIKKKEKPKYWKYGDQTKMAKHADISASYMSDILHRRRSPGKELAQNLSYALQNTKPDYVPVETWLFNKQSRHPAFFGDPIE